MIQETPCPYYTVSTTKIWEIEHSWAEYLHAKQYTQIKGGKPLQYVLVLAYSTEEWISQLEKWNWSS